MSNSIVTVIRGKANYAKIIGEPRLNYNKDGKEWTMDLVIDKNTEKELKALGIGDRVRRKDEYVNGEPYTTFKQRELRKDGKPNDPIRVVDINNNPWPEGKLIGNGSVVDVKFAVLDFGKGMKKGVYIRSVRVLDHVPYDTQEFEPVKEDDEFFKAAQQAALVDQARPQAEDKAFRETFLGDLNDDVDDVL